MPPSPQKRPGQKTGHPSQEAPLPAGYTWDDYVSALVAQRGSLAAVAWSLVERGVAQDAASTERAIRRLRERGQRDGGLTGQRLLRVFGIPVDMKSRARWMGLYHSPFNDLPVHLCTDQLRLWDRPPVSESRARVWIHLGQASVALRQRSFDLAAVALQHAAAVHDAPHAATIERNLCTAYLDSRRDPEHLDTAGRAQLDAAAVLLQTHAHALEPDDLACFRARLVDHEAYLLNHRGEHRQALELYQTLPSEDVHPFASYRRDAGMAYGLLRMGERGAAEDVAKRACDHAGDGGYVRLRVMGLLLLARVRGALHDSEVLTRAQSIAVRLQDGELIRRVERARGGS